eukprot:scaffold1996_cov377-Prasinococcus_capsulatus_cf.AAC.4
MMIRIPMVPVTAAIPALPRSDLVRLMSSRITAIRGAGANVERKETKKEKVDMWNARMCGLAKDKILRTVALCSESTGSGNSPSASLSIAEESLLARVGSLPFTSAQAGDQASQKPCNFGAHTAQGSCIRRVIGPYGFTDVESAHFSHGCKSARQKSNSVSRRRPDLAKGCRSPGAVLTYRQSTPAGSSNERKVIAMPKPPSYLYGAAPRRQAAFTARNDHAR